MDSNGAFVCVLTGGLLSAKGGRGIELEARCGLNGHRVAFVCTDGGENLQKECFVVRIFILGNQVLWWCNRNPC